MRALLAGLAAALALAAPARAEPPVWVVRDADSEVLIFGSFHILPPGLAWRPAALDAALRRADDLWFELPVDPATEQATARIAATTGTLGPDQSLFRILPPKDAERLLKVARDYGVDPAGLARLKPWLAEVALALAVYQRAGADAAYGVEETVSAAAPPTIRREAFETPEEQLGFFDQAPLADQIASLSATLDQIETEPDAYQTLVQAWLAGDLAGMERETETLRGAAPVLFRRLVTERNARWAATLDRRLKGKGRTVVIVGAGHLVGRESVPARLRALGYSVTGP